MPRARCFSAWWRGGQVVSGGVFGSASEFEDLMSGADTQAESRIRRVRSVLVTYWRSA
jgi:hypothetical protein